MVDPEKFPCTVRILTAGTDIVTLGIPGFLKNLLTQRNAVIRIPLDDLLQRKLLQLTLLSFDLMLIKHLRISARSQPASRSWRCNFLRYSTYQPPHKSNYNYGMHFLRRTQGVFTP